MRTEPSPILPAQGPSGIEFPSMTSLGLRQGHIVYLVESPLDTRDYKRLGMGWMARQGYQVHVLDVADLAFPQMPKDRSGYNGFDNIEIRVIRSMAEFHDASSLLAGARLLICFVVYGERTHPLYRVLSCIDTPYLRSYDSPVPYEDIRSSAHKGLWSLAGDLFWRVRRIGFARAAMLCAQRALRTVKPPDFVIFGGRRSVTMAYPISATTRPIWAHAKDYDLYLEEVRKGCDPQDIAVFIDEYLPYHRDLAAFGNRPPMEDFKYYALLRRLFDRVEAELGLRVVIAACPRADYSDKPGVFGDRKVIFSATPGLVGSSKLVLAHRSTAINYAVLFRKPVMLTTTREIYNSHHKPYLNGFAKALGRKLEYIDNLDSIDFAHVFDFDEAPYAAYQEDYIKTAESPIAPFWEIVMSEFEGDQSKLQLVHYRGDQI